jgi:phosphoglycolate phosphatase-like HAD superfamily hydrolase
VRVCLITSLSRRLLSLVLDALGWWRLIDLTLCPDDVPRGCPWPDLALTAMLRLGVEDVRAAAFAGSTASEIECGKRAGAAVVAGVLTGGHTSDRLRSAGATHLIDGITQLPELLPGRSTAADTGSAVGDSAPTAAASGGPAAAPSSAAASSTAPAAARGHRYP